MIGIPSPPVLPYQMPRTDTCSYAASIVVYCFGSFCSMIAVVVSAFVAALLDNAAFHSCALCLCFGLAIMVHDHFIYSLFVHVSCFRPGEEQHVQPT